MCWRWSSPTGTSPARWARTSAACSTGYMNRAAEAELALLARFLLELRHPVQIAVRGHRAEQPAELGVLAHVGLAEEDRLRRIDPGSEQDRGRVVEALAELGRVVGDRDRVEVDDAIDRVAAVLSLDVLADRADVVAEVLAAGRLDAAEDPGHTSGNLLALRGTAVRARLRDVRGIAHVRRDRIALAAATLCALALGPRPPTPPRSQATKTGEGGPSSLRGAVQKANERDGNDTVVLAPGRNQGSVFSLRRCGPDASEEDLNDGGDLDHTDAGSKLTIVGGGNTIRNRCDGERVLHTAGGGDLEVSAVTLRDGDSLLGGGAIQAQDLVVRGSRLTANETVFRGGAINALDGDDRAVGDQRQPGYGRLGGPGWRYLRSTAAGGSPTRRSAATSQQELAAASARTPESSRSRTPRSVATPATTGAESTSRTTAPRSVT